MSYLCKTSDSFIYIIMYIWMNNIWYIAAFIVITKVN